MEELVLNKKFDTKEELEKFTEEICNEYIVVLVNYMPVEIDKEIYGIESIFHFGKRK